MFLVTKNEVCNQTYTGNNKGLNFCTVKVFNFKCFKKNKRFVFKINKIYLFKYWFLIERYKPKYEDFLKRGFHFNKNLLNLINKL